MREKIVAGNWKMNLLREEAFSLASELAAMTERSTRLGTNLVIAPPAIYLGGIAQLIKGSVISLAAQNCAAQQSGAFTGEVSAAMLKSIGVKYVIVGHSERRTLFHESDEVVAEKIRRILEAELIPILCVGESLGERESGTQEAVVGQQLTRGLYQVIPQNPPALVIAYEPVWAIGTGKTATPEQAGEMHAFIRKHLANQYGAAPADRIPLLYGGSCNEKNAATLFANPDIDGGLIGGASLKSDSFMKIAGSMA